MKLLLDIEIRPAACAGFIEVIKTTGEPCVDASGAFCGIVNIKEEPPVMVRVS
jgi:hypothetical protein